MNNIIIAASKDWFNANNLPNNLNGINYKFITKKSELNLKDIKKINPKYIFFPHWNWIVEEKIYNSFECIVFHTAPLPYGRGGSPIQNLILKGIKMAPVCALKMTEEIDGGPIYLKKNVSLSGNIEDIFNRISKVIEGQILKICMEEISPKPQLGKVKKFKRLTRKDNELSPSHSLNEIYDRIRMVDGLDYPRAFIDFGDYEVSFSKASLAKNQLSAQVNFKIKIK